MKTYIYQQRSNQYKKVRKSHLLEISLVFLFVAYISSITLWAKPMHTDDLQQYSFGQFPAVAFAAELKIAGTSGELYEVPTVENVLAYIGKVFGQTSTYAAGKASMCFVTEGMRDSKQKEVVDTEAQNFNCWYSKDGKVKESKTDPTDYSTSCPWNQPEKAWSVDCGIAQINVLGKVCPKELFNFKENINEAYRKFQQSGNKFTHWFGKGCN